MEQHRRGQKTSFQKKHLNTMLPVPEIKISALKKAEIPAVTDIADAELGAGFLSGEEMAIYLGDKGKYLFLVAREQKNVVGFCYASRMDTAEIKEQHAKLHLNDGRPYPVAAAMLRSVAISGQYKGQGIGSGLVQAAFDRLDKAGIRTCYVLGWERDGKADIGSILLHAGCVQQATIPDYWAEDSRQRNYYCASCGQPPCHCSAVVFSRQSLSR